tara:strand:- start:3582 stop:4025 length:444 start_codon:yes stop_codon:yes gene_type:complete
MSSQFGHLKKYDPRGQTAEFPLPIDGDPQPKITLKHAGQTNRPYTNAVVKHNAKSGALRRGRVDANLLAENLNLDRELFPQFVITGWSGIEDTEGKPVPYSMAACAEFLKELPDWIVQELSTFAARASNFLPDDTPSEAEVEEQAKN